MKSSIKYFASLIGVAGLSLSISLPTLAQSSPSPNSPTPSPGSGGALNQPSDGQAPGSRMNPPGSIRQPGMMNQPGSMNQPGMMYQSEISVPSSSEPMSIGMIVDESPSFELFNALLRVAAIEEPGLLDELNGDGDKYTVFAPTDEAFAALPEGTIRALVQPENRDLLVDLLSYHVVPGEVTSADVSSVDLSSNDVTDGLTPPSGDFQPSDSTGNAITPDSTNPSDFPTESNGVNRGDSMTSSSNINPSENPGSNAAPVDSVSGSSTSPQAGGIRVGDETNPGGSPTQAGSVDQEGSLVPPSGDLNPNENPGNVDRSDVIEPNSQSDAGMPMLQADASGAYTVNGARVLGADIQASNGIIHAIDRVLLPSGIQSELQ